MDHSVLIVRKKKKKNKERKRTCYMSEKNKGNIPRKGNKVKW